MNKRNRKGIEFGMRTLVLFTVLLVLLSLISVWFLQGFRGSERISGVLLRETEDTADDLDLDTQFKALKADGECTGREVIVNCYHYYQTEGNLECVDDTSESGIQCSGLTAIPYCAFIDAYPADSWQLGRIACRKHYLEPSSIRVHSYDYRGQSICVPTRSRPWSTRYYVDETCPEYFSAPLYIREKYPDRISECRFSCSVLSDGGKEVCELFTDHGCTWEEF